MSENNEQNKNKKPNLKDNLSKLIKVILISIIAFVVLYFFSKSRANAAINMSSRYLKEMITVLPAVLVIMGLADVWMPTSLVKKYLGHSAGIRGKFLAIILGTIPAGPMYVALPLAGELLRKGASLSNIITFLGVWASLKATQIGVEIKFIGLKFSLLRLVFTLISVLLIGIIMEKFIEVDKEF
ncbi:MAG: permease [Bacillota bacterium]